MRPSGPYEPAARGRVGRRRKVAQIVNTGKRLQRPCARASRAIDPILRGMLHIHLCARPWEARCSCGVKWSGGGGVAQIRPPPGLGHLVLAQLARRAKFAASPDAESCAHLSVPIYYRLPTAGRSSQGWPVIPTLCPRRLPLVAGSPVLSLRSCLLGARMSLHVQEGAAAVLADCKVRVHG
jgi:hypothetical protein